MSSLDVIAETLDSWVDAGTVSITETRDSVVVYQLDGHQARHLADLAVQAGLGTPALEDPGGELEAVELTDSLTRITARLQLAPPPTDVERVLTNTAFEAALKRARSWDRLWVRRLSAPFETVGVRYSPWEDGEPPPASSDWPELGKVVRLLGPVDDTLQDLSRWILSDPRVASTVSGATYEIWKALAARAAATALANEVEPDGTLMFRGPPMSRFAADGSDDLDPGGHVALHQAALWAYESPHEVENRQGLMAAEIARAGLRAGSLGDLAEIAAHALDGARIAYQFGVTQQSREALKALGDLRKAVIEETAKISEITRGLATAVAGAVFGNIGLIVARLTLPANNVFIGPAAAMVGVVLALYVAVVIGTGCHFLIIQRQNREEWRPRLYGFLSPQDQDLLVEKPIDRAEKAFFFAAVLGGFMSLLLLAAVILIARASFS